VIGLGISGEMWVDGSFLTEKDEPEDVDIVVFAPSKFFDEGTERQIEFLDGLASDRDTVRKLFSCHSGAIAQYDEKNVNWPLYMSSRNDFEDKFGHSVATRQPKGIVIVPLVISSKARDAA
jgi:hypothetical protein